MPFGLKNAPSEFQNIMNDIFTPYTGFIIVCIDDVLIFSNTIDQHFKHLQTFISVMERNGLAAFASKLLLFQTKIRFLGHNIYQGTIKPIQRALVFADKFLMKSRTANNYKDFWDVSIMFLISFQIYDKFVHRFSIDFLTREFLQGKSDTTIPL